MAITTYRGAELGAALVNTVGSHSGTEFLPDVAALHSFLRSHGVDQAPTEADLVLLRRLRERLSAVFLEDDGAAKVAALNPLLAEIPVVGRLVPEEGSGWRLERRGTDPGLAARLKTLIATDLARLIEDLGPGRLGYCRADDCADAFVDTSRNRSRRYCADTCSTRTNVAAYRRRQRSAT